MIYLMFSFPHFGNKIKRSVKFRQSTRNILKIRWKTQNDIIYHYVSETLNLCLTYKYAEYCVKLKKKLIIKFIHAIPYLYSPWFGPYIIATTQSVKIIFFRKSPSLGLKATWVVSFTNVGRSKTVRPFWNDKKTWYTKKIFKKYT